MPAKKTVSTIETKKAAVNTEEAKKDTETISLEEV